MCHLVAVAMKILVNRFLLIEQETKQETKTKTEKKDDEILLKCVTQRDDLNLRRTHSQRCSVSVVIFILYFKWLTFFERSTY